MKRGILSVFFCFAFLGASAAVRAETAPSDAVPAAAVSAGVLDKSSPDAVQQPAPIILQKELAALENPGQDPVSGRMFNACPKDGEPNTVYFLRPGDEEPFDKTCQEAASPANRLTDIFGLNMNGAALNDTEGQGLQADYAGPDVPIVVNKNVKSFISYFQTRGRKYFEKWLGRSQNYMSMLKGILRENGLPEDLSYIAFIESGLNPTAKSRANAVGMWQFIRGTALMYGLRVDWWIDERMDPEKATYAAARYFRNLYDQFGSWYLAAAGYNAGEGKVMRAVKKHNSEDFWILASHKKPFKRETKEYVPKYLAAIMIAKDPKNYGFDEQEFIDGLPYDKVKVSQATDLRIIADAAGTTVDEIKRLNPELLRWFTPPNYPDYEVKIPSGKKDQFEENLSRIPAPERISFLQHKVKRGETVARIAKRYGVTVKPILYLNNLKSAKYVKPGTVIAVPIRASESARLGKEAAEIITYPGTIS